VLSVTSLTGRFGWLCRERKRKQMADLTTRVQELEGENLQLVHDVAARDAEIAALREQLASPFRGAGGSEGGARAAATDLEPAVLSGAVLVGMGGQWLRLRPPLAGAAARPPAQLPALPMHGLVPLGLGPGYAQGFGPVGLAALPQPPAGVPHRYSPSLRLSQGLPVDLYGSAGLAGLGPGFGAVQGLGSGLPAMGFDIPPGLQGWPPPGPGPGAQGLHEGGGDGRVRHTPGASMAGGVPESGPFAWAGGAPLGPPAEGVTGVVGQRLARRGSGSDPGVYTRPGAQTFAEGSGPAGAGRGRGRGLDRRAGSY